MSWLVFVLILLIALILLLSIDWLSTVLPGLMNLRGQSSGPQSPTSPNFDELRNEVCALYSFPPAKLDTALLRYVVLTLSTPITSHTPSSSLSHHISSSFFPQANASVLPQWLGQHDSSCRWLYWPRSHQIRRTKRFPPSQLAILRCPKWPSHCRTHRVM